MSRAAANRPATADSSITIVESENDFPFAKVTQVIVGSAHAVAKTPEAEEVLLGLLQKLVDQYHGDGPSPLVEVEYKS